MTHLYTMFSSGGHSARRTPVIAAALLFAFLLFPQAGQDAQAQGTYNFGSYPTISANNGQQGITFDITAHRSIRLHRIWNTFNTGSGAAEIWVRPGGTVNQNSGWVYLGGANYSASTNTAPTEIPYTLDFLINANETYGVMVFTTSGGSRYRSGTTPYTFTNADMTIDTQFWGVYGSTNPSTNTTNVNFGFYPRQFCGTIYYDDGILGPNDAGINSIDSPQNFCAGNEDVIVTLFNFGTNQLTSATINWSVNGVPQTAYSWTGLLDTLNSTTRSTQVTLANMNFQSGVPYTITAWTSMPNGVQDTINVNDSASVTVQAAIAGSYTIGGASPDYSDFASAVNDLNQYGLCGPVVFNVRPGTYNEQIELDAIPGASAVNTVTFQSETGNKNDVDLTFAATGTGNNYVVSPGEASFVTFKDMTMTATGGSYGRVVYFGGGATDITFENCELVSRDVNSTSTYMAVVYSDYGTQNDRTSFIDCGVREGAYGLYLYGAGTTSTEDDVTVQGCEFTGQYYSPVRTYYVGSMDFVDNRVYLTNPAYTYRYPAQFYYGQNNNFERNIFFSDGGAYGYGIYLYYQNYYQSGSTRFVNNMVSVLNNTTRTYRGVYMYRSYNTLFAHNTVHINSSYSSGAAVYSYYTTGSDFYNNIFYNSGAGYAWYVNSGSYVNDTDFNLFYTTGNNIAYWSGSRSTLAQLQATSGMDANSISKTVSYADPFTGDLHLTSPSEDDTDLFGTLLNSVGVDIDGETRVNPYMGADEACYVTPGSLNYSFV
ncbi:MAG: hypothetical protein RRA94_07815, partial [Bacteroidota bacterium]|nr:hypothetical protein [Bacteroidota bacterium]